MNICRKTHLFIWAYGFLIPLIFSLITLPLKADQNDNKIPIEAFAKASKIRGISFSSEVNHYLLVTMQGAQPQITIHSLKGDLGFEVQKYLLPSGMLDGAVWINDTQIISSVTLIAKDKRGRKKSYSRQWCVIDIVRKTRTVFLSYPINLQVANGSDDFLSPLKDDPDHVLISYAEKKGYYPAIFKVNINNGEKEIIETAREPIDQWFANEDGLPVLGYGSKKDKATVIVRDNKTKEWLDIGEKPLFKGDYFFPLSQGLNEKTMYVSSSIGQGRRKIYHYDYENHMILEKVFEHPEVDVSGIIYSRKRDKILAAVYVKDRVSFHYFDEEFKKLNDTINSLIPERKNQIIELDDNEKEMIIYSVLEQGPGKFYYLNSETEELKLLASNETGMENYKLAPVKPVTYFSRDGLEIHSYLTRPVDQQGPGPAIILPHGGPWARDTLGFDAWAQFFANRGYTVLQPNFRGSTGYGSYFIGRSSGEWGKKMQEDLTDGVSWLVEKKLANPDKICIVGGSYGGYAALMGVVKDPDLYQCAISYAPVTDIKVHLATYKGTPDAKALRQRIMGDSKSSAYSKTSPNKQARKIKVPILLVHGDSDIRVDIQQSELMSKALKKGKKKYQYVVLNSASHFLMQADHQIKLFQLMEKFLSENLDQK